MARNIINQTQFLLFMNVGKSLKRKSTLYCVNENPKYTKKLRYVGIKRTNEDKHVLLFTDIALPLYFHCFKL